MKLQKGFTLIDLIMIFATFLIIVGVAIPKIHDHWFPEKNSNNTSKIKICPTCHRLLP